MREVTGYIKFKDKKAITKPLKGELGYVKVWEMSESQSAKEYFTHKEIRYNLISSTEVK